MVEIWNHDHEVPASSPWERFFACLLIWYVKRVPDYWHCARVAPNSQWHRLSNAPHEVEEGTVVGNDMSRILCKARWALSVDLALHNCSIYLNYICCWMIVYRLQVPHIIIKIDDASQRRETAKGIKKALNYKILLTNLSWLSFLDLLLFIFCVKIECTGLRSFSLGRQGVYYGYCSFLATKQLKPLNCWPIVCLTI